MTLNHEIINKFPCIIKSKLLNGTFDFPPGTQFEYAPIFAYRAVSRAENDYSEINANDFKSYAEKGKRSKKDLSNPYNMAEYCSVSMCLKRETIEELFHFPAGREKTKIIQGNIESKNGPMWQDSETHIHWWMYKDIDVSGFEYTEVE